MKHFINKESKLVLGGLTVTILSALFSGCTSTEEKPEEKPVETVKPAENKILRIQEVAPGQYKLVESMPTTGPTQAFVTDLNGSTRIMNEAEMKTFAEAEMKKVENNTSNLTSANPQQPKADEGFGMGELLLAGAAGALLGGVAANMLSNNQNFQARQSAGYGSPSGYQSSHNPNPNSGGFGGNNQHNPNNNGMNGNNNNHNNAGTSSGTSAKANATPPSKQSFFGGTSSSSTTTSSTSSSTKPDLTKSSPSSDSKKDNFFGG